MRCTYATDSNARAICQDSFFGFGRKICIYAKYLYVDVPPPPGVGVSAEISTLLIVKLYLRPGLGTLNKHRQWLCSAGPKLNWFYLRVVVFLLYLLTTTPGADIPHIRLANGVYASCQVLHR